MVFIYFHVKCLIMDNNFISYQCLLNTMEDIYPVFPLPDNKQFKICIDFIKSESFALPVIEFCEYVHVYKINWLKCSWEYDLMPLEYDTTILPHYIFSTSFLRYYFPTCLNLTIKYFFGDYHKYEIGNIDSFVGYTIGAVIENYKNLNESEKNLLGRILKLMENNSFYDYKDECIKLKNKIMNN